MDSCFCVWSRLILKRQHLSCSVWHLRIPRCDGGGHAVSLTQHQRRPAGYPGFQTLVEDLMEEHDGLTGKTNTMVVMKTCSSLSLESPTALSHTHYHNQSHHLFRKMLLTSSWVMDGFLELAAMRSGRRKLLTRMWSCWTYSASASSMLNTTWFLFLMLSAWGERM